MPFKVNVLTLRALTTNKVYLRTWIRFYTLALMSEINVKKEKVSRDAQSYTLHSHITRRKETKEKQSEREKLE